MNARLLLALPLLLCTACDPDVPDKWEKFVPTEGLTSSFGDKEEGGVKKVVLNYTREEIEGDALRGKFSERIGKEGFEKLSECVSSNGTSSAMFVSSDKEVFQVIINLLGDKMYDVELQRATGMPGVALPNPDNCKYTDHAEKVCELDASNRCKFK
jgi:hypothetical protein